MKRQVIHKITQAPGNDVIIREIEAGDNPQVARIVRKVLVEDMGAPKKGTAYEDKAVDHMYETYTTGKSVYFVIEEKGKVIGGAGIAPLDNHDGNVCELQKMYFLEAARGKGLGKKMIDLCLEKAEEYGYDHCYLETMPYMKAAQALYKKKGFYYLDAPVGNTGHSSCPVWMLKDLK
ncbi:GNAT family N-acetyltransferase [Sinomicrobium kalidii]|uniref:GNAT family N-acetyltransferase n=1 Tax=Sinomicrobium kalidii TaxID=2900738 RepID=UPI001E39CF2E|nr:GNAT family N-acetyltransferase [Sinomicrobium kalidii]UGU16109.1 GNAT family N-acetyltransferase [Sinomicrobium kalidii]